MSRPDKPISDAHNPFESPALPLPRESAVQAGGESPALSIAESFERPTPAEMLSVVVSMFATLAIARRTSSVFFHDAPLPTHTYILVGYTLAAVPLLAIRIKTTSWRGVSPGLWLWFGCACERCLYLAMPFVLAFEPLSDEYLLLPPLLVLARGACYSLPLYFCGGIFWRAISVLEILWSAFVAGAFVMEANLVNPLNRTLAYVAILVTLAIAVLTDRAQGGRYSWWHCCGVLVFVFWTAKELWPIIQFAYAS